MIGRRWPLSSLALMDDVVPRLSDSPFDHRVHRTIGFVDLSGFTSFTEVEGDAAATELLAGFRSCVREIAARRGVRIAKWLGDGAMLVCSEAETLTEAIVEIEHAIEAGLSPLPLRAGLASGPVILFEGDDYIGAAVNLAARLCAMAPPSEVWAPAAMVSSLMVNTRAIPLGRHHIVGFAEPLELVQIDSIDCPVHDEPAIR
jgi:class 3 adenylate cyclase